MDDYTIDDINDFLKDLLNEKETLEMEFNKMKDLLDKRITILSDLFKETFNREN